MFPWFFVVLGMLVAGLALGARERSAPDAAMAPASRLRGVSP